MDGISGLSLAESIGFGWLDAVHPDDREATLQAWRDTERLDLYTIEHKIKFAGTSQYRWHKTRATPVRDETDNIVEWLGTSTDIHELKQLQQEQEVLLAEVQHRARNVLAVVRAIVHRTLQNSQSLEEFGREFTGRLTALSRVQSVIARSNSELVDLHELIDAELTAHLNGNRTRVSLQGAPIQLPTTQAQVISLAVHELATNAVKHGALNFENATIGVEWFVDNESLTIDWRETGVPMGQGVPERRGYGRTLIEHALAYQLSADTLFEFTPTGIHCTIRVPLATGDERVRA